MILAILIVWIITELNAPLWITALAWLYFAVAIFRLLESVYDAGKLEGNELEE